MIKIASGLGVTMLPGNFASRIQMRRRGQLARPYMKLIRNLRLTACRAEETDPDEKNYLENCVGFGCAWFFGRDCGWGQAKADDYSIAVHVSASEYLGLVNDQAQIITVTIGGKHYQLQGPTSSARAFVHGNGLLNLGDYQAKLVEDTHKSAYESMQVYEFLLPDGSKRKFGVVGQSE
jgi:hypothetical protein